MSDFSSSPPPLSPDKILPPVQAPTAGFLIQLFVVPGLIVAVIVMVWLLFNWLAHMGSDPQAELAALKRNNDSSWQAAYNLAMQMGQDRTGALRGDAAFAKELGAVFEATLDPNSPRNKHKQFIQYYLSQALGMFSVDDGVPALLKAANADPPLEDNTRMAALQSLATQTEQRSRQANWPYREAILTLFLNLSTGQDQAIRERVSYMLGIFDEPAAIQRLLALLADPSFYVRCNAATGLARRGRDEALPVLNEMLQVSADDLLKIPTPPPLDPNETPITTEDAKNLAEANRVRIARNSLESLVKLHAARPELNLASVLPAVERLKAEPNRELRDIARDALGQLLAVPVKSS